MVEHPNGMRFEALDADQGIVSTGRYVSIGGGFIRALDSPDSDESVPLHEPVPYPFSTGNELLALCEQTGWSVAQLMMANESIMRPAAEVRQGLARIAAIMNACINRGCGVDNQQADRLLPGGLRVRRRAPALYRELQRSAGNHDVLFAMDWVNLFAMAVNEENAASGQVVTAPTNGAAGLL